MDVDETTTSSNRTPNSHANKTPSTNEVIAPHPHIPTNDGTHRITVKWTPPTKLTEFENDKSRLNEALITLMTTLFQDDDGVFYRWESEDLIESKAASSLTEVIARDYVSPKVTFIGSRNLMIFGIRFGFLSGPTKWLKSKNTKTVLKQQKLEVLVSNSKSTSGNVVTAGYILLKAPNTTHRHFYTQYLRSKLPETFPYFDIVRYKKTPMDQLIPHLAIQCGEKHVTPVCKGLLTILTGTGSALFLPRYAFSTMDQDQIKRHFEVHQKWCHSLKPISLSPKISHLDQQRIEYYDDGRIVKRSTREWALTLTLENGQPAHCDAINGGSNRTATLVCPQSFLNQAQKEWSNYRSRMNPPSHREARYFESVTDLPDLSNIRIEIETNVSLLEHLSSAEIWQQAPPSVRDPNPPRGRQKKKAPPPNQQPRSSSTQSNANEQTDIQPDDRSCASRSSSSGDTTQDASELRSTASTAATTNAPPPDRHSRFKELERMIKNAQKQSEIEGKTSASHLSSLQSQFSDLDGTLSNLQSAQTKLASEISSLQDHNTKQFDEIRGNMVTSMEVTNTMSQNMVDIRSQFSQMSTFMMDLARKMDSVLSARSDGVPPEVNVTQRDRTLHQESESSSILGDPSQTATSDASKTLSQLSSAGKRSLAAATIIPAIPPATSIQHLHQSPIKKKHRARGSNSSQQSEDITDDTHNKGQLNVNLDSRFQACDDSQTAGTPNAATITPMESDPEMRDTSESDALPPSRNSNLQQPAPPNQQYNNHHGSAGADPE